jgi:hypothetical protein
VLKIILAAASAATLNIDVEMQSVERDRGIVSAVFKLNNDSTDSFKSVFVECAFLDAGGRALDVITAHVQNLHPQTARYGKASAVRESGIASAKCYVAEAID